MAKRLFIAIVLFLLLCPAQARSDSISFFVDGVIVDGQYDALYVYGNSIVDVYGGTFIWAINLYDNSVLNFYGGTNLQDINTYGTSTTNFFGGTTGSITAHGAPSGTVNVYGGQIVGQGLLVSPLAGMTVYGHGFSYTAFPSNDGLLTGYWGTGEAFSIALHTSYAPDVRLYDVNSDELYHIHDNEVVLGPAHVPEPSAMLLLGSGLLGLVGLNRRREA